METQIISINLIPNLSTPAVVRVSQYDVGRPLVFKVYDGTSPADLTGVTAVIEGTKRSGLGFSESGTVSDNTVTLDTTLAMTQEDGSIHAEIRFSKTGEDVGTANFILAVEKTPHAEGTTDGTHETMADLQSQLDALDTRVEALEAGGGGGGLTEAVKSAMLQIAQKVAYIDENGQTYYDALYDALYPPAELVSISAVYTQSGTVYNTDSLDDLKSDLVVTANYSDGTSETVTDYTLSGTLAEGTSTVTVSYEGLTDTFNVTVSHAVTDTTAQIATEGYVSEHRGTGTSASNYRETAKTYGGITIKYQMDAPSTSLSPAGIIPYNDSTIEKGVGCLIIYDSSGTIVNHVDEKTDISNDTRWAQLATGTLTEFKQTWNVSTFTQITFSVDIRYLDDAYMYDSTTGQVWFAGKNTPYYGMSNISEAGD